MARKLAPWRPIENYYQKLYADLPPLTAWPGVLDWEDAENAEVIGEPVGETTQKFNDLYHLSGAWRWVRWAGVSTLKPPTDLWAYQQLVFGHRPEIIIECGVYMGGTTLFLHCLNRLFGTGGKVIGIDADLSMVHSTVKENAQDGILLIQGVTTDPEVFEVVRKEAEGKSVMVILDSDHSYENVLAELRMYAPLVGDKQFIIVEDTNIDYPSKISDDMYPDGGPGRALDEFMASEEGHPFVRYPVFDMQLLTNCPGGCIVRVR